MRAPDKRSRTRQASVCARAAGSAAAGAVTVASAAGASYSLRHYISPSAAPRRYTGNKLPVGVPGGINTGVMLVDARKLGRTYSFRRYWAEVTRIVGEGIYHPVHGKYYGTADLPSLGDQDILNVLFYDDASLLHLLPSRWNTLQPAGRIRQSAPDFVPMPPCIMHFSAETYAAPKDVNRLGNGAFRFVSDWEA